MPGNTISGVATPALFYGPKDRRFPKRHPVLEGMYPGAFVAGIDADA